MTASPAKQKAYKKGLWAEYVSAVWLFCKGYRVLVRRYKTPAGEIDLICRTRTCVVYVEVKYRQTMEDSLTAVGPRQIARMQKAAEVFLSRHPNLSTLDQRFDLIAWAPKKFPKHVKNLA